MPIEIEISESVMRKIGKIFSSNPYLNHKYEKVMH